MSGFPPVVIPLLFCLLSLPVSGREAWLLPERSSATPGAVLALSLSAGESFSADGSPVAAAQVEQCSGWLAGIPLEFRSGPTSDPAWRVESVLSHPGVAVVGLSLKRVRRELVPGEVPAYLRSLRLVPDEFLPSREASSPWLEDRTIHAKAFVRVGQPGADESGWGRELGTALELVPERDPTSVRRDGQFAVRLLGSGTALPRMAVVFLSEGESREHVGVTDDAGRTAVVLDVPGRWLILAADLRRSKGPAGRWICQIATLCLEVSP